MKYSTHFAAWAVWFTGIGMMAILPFNTSGQELVYVSSTDGKETIQKINKQAKGKYQVVETLEPTQSSTHYFNAAGATREWVHKNEDEKTSFVAQRDDDNNINIRGTFKNEKIEKSVSVDDNIWLNKVDHGLSGFARSEEESIIFWTLKLSDLEPVQFKAEKVGRETMQINGQSIEVIKIKMTLKNFLMSKLWSAHLWYRVSDGLFIKYSGAMGAPGTPVTTIEIEKGI